MSKQIIIVGGGISGLALLHYLKVKYYFQEDIVIRLLEKNDYAGGTIRTIAKDGCLFEMGPNGFLNINPRTLQLINDVHLTRNLIEAKKDSKLRFIYQKGRLYPLPSDPLSFLNSPLLNPFDKIRILFEPFIFKKNNPHETIYDFGKRRFGQKAANLFIDPMISGIYGGDAKRINFKAAFPKVYAMEQESGSVIKALIKGGKKDKGRIPKALFSFFNGMSELVHTISNRYQDDIQLNQDVKMISTHQNRYIVHANDKQYTADELFICTPAFQAASLFKKFDATLAEQLEQINYVPMIVVGLMYSEKAFKNLPKGYGYLIPSAQKKEILGVLVESNIFTNRCVPGQIVFRVMIGGGRFPDILKKSEEELVALAINEIKSTYETLGNPKTIFFTGWSKAIPQYDGNYVLFKDYWQAHQIKSKNLHLVANYLEGVSFNDCIENAYQAAVKSSLNTH